jgi:hypothetical protein
MTQNCLWKSLRLGGSSQIYEACTFFWRISAILIENMPIWAEFIVHPKQQNLIDERMGN